MPDMTFEEFRAEVVRLLKRRLYLDWAEDGREDMLRVAWEGSEGPDEFVDWYAEKYDLEDSKYESQMGMTG